MVTVTDTGGRSQTHTDVFAGGEWDGIDPATAERVELDTDVLWHTEPPIVDLAPIGGGTDMSNDRIAVASVAPMRASWGHLNVNVTDLERSIEFYERLGFTIMADEIPHLGLSRLDDTTLDDALCDAYGIPHGTNARGCILELGGGFPKLDLTAYDLGDSDEAPAPGALGCERLCLAVRDLTASLEELRRAGVTIAGGPAIGVDDLAQVAVVIDPDGTRIELIQIAPERFAAHLAG